MKKRMLSLSLALALCLGLSAPVTAAGGASGYLDSGSASMDKLSQAEIAGLLEDNPLTLPDNVFDQVPSCSAPYGAGKVKTNALQAAADRLNALRQIAGLPAVQLDLTLSEQAQYGAVIIAAQGALSHTPSQPADMDDAFYNKAYEATSSSNLYAGKTLTTAVDGFMDDSDASNIDRLGHRRWQLNPQLGKVGFGYAESNTRYRTYVAEKVFDRSGSCGDYEFVAWPASGSFPSDLFGGDIAWSVSLNPDKYSVPRQSDLTVTLTRESDGRPWTFRGSGYTAASSGAYFHVDTGNYGISNCIIFRPDGIGAYEGTYTVEIDGLRTRSGAAVQDFAYQVAFFDLDDPNAQEPQQPVSGGSDFILGGKEEYLAYWEAHSAPNIVPETSLPEDAVILIRYTGDGGAVTIPEEVTYIGSGAFYKCDNVTGVVIPGSVARIGNNAFFMCGNLTDVVVEEGVKTIGMAAFAHCYDLASVTLPESIREIGTQAFFNCPSLPTFTVPGGVTELPYGVFLSCRSMESVVIPASVTTIGAEAFYDCGELDDVYFGGTEAQWNAIDLTGEWHPRVRIHFTDGAGTQQPQQSGAFSDVPAGHWAYEFVEKAAAEGWVAGVGDGVFGVNDQVTYAQFSTMLVRAYYNDDYEAYTGPTGQWYTSFCNVANDHNLYWNTSAYRDDYLAYMVNPLDRYDMAQMLYNVLEEHDLLASFDSSVQSGIGDWDSIPANYRPAVTGVVSAGLISGMDEKGTFGGTGTMTRGQAAVVMVRLDEAVNGGGVTKPDPEPAPNPGTLKNGREATPENVVAMLKEIEKAYPTGTVWTDPVENPNTPHNPNPVSETVHRTMLSHGTDDVYACGGFAAMVSDLIFPEDMAMREVTDFSKVRPGDIVFNINGKTGAATHVWVAGSSSKQNAVTGRWVVSRAEGNLANKVNWNWSGNTAIWGDEGDGFGYNVIYTRYPD